MIEALEKVGVVDEDDLCLEPSIVSMLTVMIKEKKRPTEVQKYWFDELKRRQLACVLPAVCSFEHAVATSVHQLTASFPFSVPVTAFHSGW